MWSCGGGRVAVSFRRFLVAFLLLYVATLLTFHLHSVADVPPAAVEAFGGGEDSPPREVEVDAAVMGGGGAQVGEMRSEEAKAKDDARGKVPNCGTSTGGVTRSKFIHLGSDIILFSAFYDDRGVPSTLAPTAHIRIMAILQKDVKKRKDLKMSCAFPQHPNIPTAPVTLYEMCENHNKRFGGYILSCPVPWRVMLEEKPCAVTFHVQRGAYHLLSNNTSASVNIDYALWRPQDFQFGTCVPPLHSDISPDKIVEFVEMSLVLGAQHFIIYVHEDPRQKRVAGRGKLPSVQQLILEYYQSLGVVTLIPWRLAVGRHEIWYYGQSIAIGDCLYRNMARFKYLTFNDLDEFIVPQAPLANWTQLVAKLWSGEDIAESKPIGGYRIQSAFFTPSPAGGQSAGTSGSQRLDVMGNLERTSKTSKVRTKTIVRPRRIFELGIHHISRPMDGYDGALAGADLALLHHYRKCIADFGMNCAQKERDESMLRYRERFEERFNETQPKIDNFIKYGTANRPAEVDAG